MAISISFVAVELAEVVKSRQSVGVFVLQIYSSARNGLGN